MGLERVGRFARSRSASARASSESSRCRRRPTARKTQMYMQRYLQHFPAAGEVVIFDRSWYNRAGVEYVMGFCTDEAAQAIPGALPGVREVVMIEGGIILIKLWLEVSNDEQKRRFQARIEDPLRQWKLSPMDLPSRARWYDYSRGTRSDVEENRHPSRAMVHRAFGRQARRPLERDCSSAVGDSP